MEFIPPGLLEAMYTNFSVVYLEGVGEATPIASQIATVRTSTTAEEAFIIPGQLPRMRKWQGEREVNHVDAQEMKISSDDYELTVSVDRNHVLDAKFGIYDDQIKDLGRQSGYLWDDLAASALLNGHQALCFDGQYFFDTDHPVHPYDASQGIQANLFTSRPLTPDNYAYVRAQGGLLTGRDKRPLRVKYDTLIVGPSNEVAAKRIVESRLGFDASTGGPLDNVNAGTSKVLVFAEITDASWYLAATSNAIKPLLLVKRQEPMLVRKDAPTDDANFYRKKLLYGTDARGAVGYGPWYTALKATP